MQDEKTALRRLLRFRRREFTDRAGAARCAVHAIVMARLALAAAGNARCIAAYVSNGREVDALPLLELACAAGMETALPCVDRRDGDMHFLRWRPGDPLRGGPYGIPQPRGTAQPVTPDAIFAPLVAFDPQGNRLGQGGGFYDRAFARHPEARRIGLAWSAQQIAHVPTDAWDQRLHAVITEQEWIDFA